MPNNRQLALSPRQRYELHCQAHDISQDPAQQQVLLHLNRIYRQFHQRQQRSIWRKFLPTRHPRPVTGLYLWGGVGRGKTMLMDILYASLADENRQRQHFHQFMLQIHQQLKQIRNRRNPLETVADQIANRAKLLCLDEFHVSDITDAMLLAGLLRALFNRGITLVTTSNIEPGQLYADGLQRARFIPAIKLLKTHTEVIELTGSVDFRLQTLRQGGTYYYPLNKHNEQKMADTFAALSSYAQWAKDTIEINDRQLPILGQAEGAVWFDFKTLCDSPRSQHDYIEIAKQHHSVLLSGLVELSDSQNDAAKRFINLLDVMYDARVKLIISAATPIESIYTGERLVFEFQRATSRLLEMQSEQYLCQTHRA